MTFEDFENKREFMATQEGKRKSRETVLVNTSEGTRHGILS